MRRSTIACLAVALGACQPAQEPDKTPGNTQDSGPTEDTEGPDDTDLPTDTAEPNPPPNEDCVNGVDDDEDGLVDCADPDCALYPDCALDEDCSNGVDDDEDGLADCEDTDCARHPDCAVDEDCSNGVDDDEDGLVDCEDADCIDAESCREDCGDGTDNDLDGLVDCADGDCWGLDHCPVGEVWVTAGTLRHEREIWYGHRSYTYHNTYGSTCWVYDGPTGGSADTFTVTGVRGQLRVPTQAGGVHSCEWRVEQARFERFWSVDFRPSHSMYFEYEPRRLAARSGFSIDSACGDFGSDMLPTSLLPAGQSVVQAQWSGSRTTGFYPWPVRRGYSATWESTRHSGSYTSFLDVSGLDVSASFGEGPRLVLPGP